MCHMSDVTCLVSGVTCQVSGVMCIFVFIFFFFKQSDGASCWRVCYPRGLPRLVQVLKDIKIAPLVLKLRPYLLLGGFILSAQLEKAIFLSTLTFWGYIFCGKTRKLQEFKNARELSKSQLWYNFLNFNFDKILIKF